MAGAGIEHPAQNGENSLGAGESGAECGALGAQNGTVDPELAAVVDAWPKLPEAVRLAILALVRTAK